MQHSKTILETVANQLTKSEYERQIDAIKLFPDALRVACSLIMDKQDAIQGANRAIAVITGVNVLELFKAKAQEPVKKQEYVTVGTYLTLGMIGHRMKTNWQTVSKRLRSMGFLNDDLDITESGRAFYVEGKGWSEKVIELLQAAEAGK